MAKIYITYPENITLTADTTNVEIKPRAANQSPIQTNTLDCFCHLIQIN